MKIVDVTVENIEMVRPFMEHMIRPNYVSVDKEYFKWQFIDAAAIWGRGQDSGVIALIDSDDVVGASFASKTPFYIEGCELIGSWHHELYVSEEVAGKGYFLLLEQFRRNEFIGSAGQSLDAANVQARMRPMCWFETDRLFAVMDVVATCDLMFAIGPQTLGYLEYCRTLPISSDLTLVQVTDFCAEYNAHWMEVRSEYVLTTDRNSEYMNWRYIAHPYFEYKCCRCETAYGLVYFVWREEPVVGHSTNVARICDIIGRPQAVENALPSLLEFMSGQSIAFADFFGSNSNLNHALIAGGMKHILVRPDFDLPRYFSPHADDVRKSISFSYWPSTSLYSPRLLNHYESYITKGDVNQDRPNW